MSRYASGQSRVSAQKKKQQQQQQQQKPVDDVDYDDGLEDDDGGGEDEAEPLLFHPQTGTSVTLNPNSLTQAGYWSWSDLINYVTVYIVFTLIFLTGLRASNVWAAFAGVGSAAFLIVSIMTFVAFTKA
jgi:hypothetical protein